VGVELSLLLHGRDDLSFVAHIALHRQVALALSGLEVEHGDSRAGVA